MFRLSFNSDIVGTGSLLVNDNLYLLDTVASYGESFNTELRGTKRRIDNTNSGALCVCVAILTFVLCFVAGWL